jgi:hypothetical protein
VSRNTDPRRWVIVAAGLVVAGTVLSAAIAAGPPILGRRWPLLGLLGVWAMVWLATVAVVFRLRPATAVWVIVLGAIALRVAALAGPPVTSDDLYRYSWDGRVQAAGIDPYAAPPASAALAPFRDPWLWPDTAGCAALRRPPGCTRINRPAERTIYPPFAEAWFALAYRAGGPGARHKTWQVAGLVTDLGVVGLLLVGISRWGRDGRWAALYALSPFPVLELVNNGHVDGLAILLVLAALIVIAPGNRRPWSEVAAGALIGAAALVKLYPLVALLGLVGLPATRRALARAGAAAAVVCGLAYLPHVWAVGARVLGYLPGYLREEHYAGGGRFLVAAALHVPPSLASIASVAALAGVGGWVVVRRPPPPTAVAVLLGAVLLAASPVQPWYATSLLAMAALAGQPRWVAVVLAGYPYFFAVILASPHAVGIGEVGYGVALAVTAAAAARAARAASRAVTRSPISCAAGDTVTISGFRSLPAAIRGRLEGAESRT